MLHLNPESNYLDSQELLKEEDIPRPNLTAVPDLDPTESIETTLRPSGYAGSKFGRYAVMHEVPFIPVDDGTRLYDDFDDTYRTFKPVSSKPSAMSPVYDLRLGHVEPIHRTDHLTRSDY